MTAGRSYLRLVAVGALIGITATTVVLALAGCGSTTSAPTTLGIASSAFLNGSSIPAQYTCDGADVAPPLTWTRVPARTRSLALVVLDRDAAGGDFVHWSLYDIPRGTASVNANRLPPGSEQGTNSFGRTGYDGPCPPKGSAAHHYDFTVYALDAQPSLPAGSNGDAVRSAIVQGTIATGTLTGLYRRGA